MGGIAKKAPHEDRMRVSFIPTVNHRVGVRGIVGVPREARLLCHPVHRTYIPKHGTFTTPDPLWAKSVGASAYHYANHDPVNWSDPWGLSPGGPGAGGNSGENSDPTIDNPLAPRRKKKHFSIVLNPYEDLRGLWNADYLVGGGQGPEYGSGSNSEHLPITPGDVENYIASNNSKFGPVWTVPSLSTPGYSLQASVRPPERQRIEIVTPQVDVVPYLRLGTATQHLDNWNVGVSALDVSQGAKAQLIKELAGAKALERSRYLKLSRGLGIVGFTTTTYLTVAQVIEYFIR